MDKKKEREILDRWYARFDRSEKDLEVFRNAEHEEKIRERLLRRIVNKLPVREGTGLKRHRIPYLWMGMAAAIMLLAVSITVFLHIENSAQLPIGQYEWQTSKAETGKLLKVRLGDGSEILLNAGSSLSYPRQFAQDNREVVLEGEAFFDVAPDANKPFIVNTGKIDITVLGTSFNILAHPGLDTKVTVATGKVSVTAQDKTLSLLLPNEQISYNNKTDEYEVIKTDAELVTAWQKGEIRLDGASFQELAIIIQNNWGMSLKTTSERLKSASYKTTFYTHDEIDDIMKVISRISSANYQIMNQKIKLYE